MPDPTTDEAKPGVLAQVALAGVVLAEEWLRETVLLLMLVSSLVALGKALSVGSAPWAAAGLLAAIGGLTALFGPLLRLWGHLGTWLIMLTTLAFDLGVILVAGPTLSNLVARTWPFCSFGDIG